MSLFRYVFVFSDHPPARKKFLSFLFIDTEEKKKQRKKNKKVKFAENVKEPKGNGEEYRRKRESLRRNVPEPVIKPDKTGSVCRNNMPANRIARYNGILRDRDHRVQCSY